MDLWKETKVYTTSVLMHLHSFTKDEYFGEYERNPASLDELVSKKFQKARDFLVVKASSTVVNGVSQITNVEALKELADRDRACPVAQYQIAIYYLQGNELTQYKKYLRLSADQGYLPAEAFLGNSLLGGIIGTESEKMKKTLVAGQEAFKWILKAAYGGDAKSQYNLACIYKRGRCGKEVNLQKVIYILLFTNRHSIYAVYPQIDLLQTLML
jgi:TPR repeat protein